jgi:stage III sporulation protein SpoIIIAA
LNENGVDIDMFANLVKECLTQGRGKHRNLMIVGPANCGKTFILKPLTQLYVTFCNPACGTFAWVGIQDAECIIFK